MDWKQALLTKGVEQLRRTAQDATKTARRVAESRQGQQAIAVARVAAQSGPVREIARLCGRAGVAGAVVDGSLGGMQALKAMREGRVDGRGAVKHACAEAGCGFVTSSAGTAGTVAVYVVTGTMGPAALALGMGASMGSRWAYRQVVGDTLPHEQVDSRAGDDESSPLEEIGPQPQPEDD